jgi:glycosyltransferase involved in cell wall biosynthesis
MCSKNEALGRVTIEAMSRGTPVIGFDNAGTSEIIKHAYNGFLYKEGASELSENNEHDHSEQKYSSGYYQQCI